MAMGRFRDSGASGGRLRCCPNDRERVAADDASASVGQRILRNTDAGYALPDGQGGWLTTDPDQHETYMAERNATLSYQLKPLVRMLKRWNRVHSERLESFHLEVMTASMFQSLGSN